MAELRRPQVGDRVTFDGKQTSWLTRAISEDGRYTLLTAALFGEVHYTIIDWRERVRGAMNVIGGGLGIFTLAGEDPAIAEAIAMLQGTPTDTHPDAHLDCWELSHRNRVGLRVTSVRAPSGAAS